MLRNIILFFILFIVAEQAYTQSLYRYRFEEPWSISVSTGPTQYFGELYSLWKYNEGIQPDWNANIALRRTLGTRIRARAEFSYYQISGQDPPSDPRAFRYPRNLHFRARNMEASMIGEFHWKPVKVYNITRSYFNLYAFAGVGVSSNDPKALDPRAALRNEDLWVPLRPLQIENNPYNKYIVVFPTGIGAKYKLSVYADLTLELNYRWTLTDYMDDVSAFNISEFYQDLLADYGTNGTGPNPDRLLFAIRNPAFYIDDELTIPDVDRIISNRGRIRRGSGLTERFDGYMGLNLGIEIYLSPDIWDNWIFRNKLYEKRFRFW